MRVAVSLEGFNRREVSMGTTLSDTSREQPSENATTYASSRKSCPDTPCTKASGRKITTVVSVLATIAALTSAVPRTADSARLSSRSCWRR